MKMAGNSFGSIFRITTFGESHGPGIGVVIDGCPSNIEIDGNDIQAALDRRRPGQSPIVTARNEPDRFEILSGVIDDKTTGAPITIWIPNKDHRPADYSHLERVYRPSHADFTYEAKYGLRDFRGGGRSSARETAARVAAGSIAEKILGRQDINVIAWVSRVGNIRMKADDGIWQRAEIDANDVRCPDPAAAASMKALIEEVRDAGDTVGGIISCRISNCPAGLGEPVYDKLQADLGKAILGINACKGFEFGSGFSAADLRGSTHNDEYYSDADGAIRTRTNYSGGIQGGISNGMDITFNAVFKPVSTLMQNQVSVDSGGNTIELKGKGRHDPCVLPRAVPVVEAMAAIVIADHMLRARALGLDI